MVIFEWAGFMRKLAGFRKIPGVVYEQTPYKAAYAFSHKKKKSCRLPVYCLSLKANIISVSQATSPSTVAMALPLPIEPLRRTISTSRRS
jgi:hypothetical protein